MRTQEEVGSSRIDKTVKGLEFTFMYNKKNLRGISKG